MTSVTYGLRKSLCKVTFYMYQGALASFLNVFQFIINTYSTLRLYPFSANVINELINK
jgi:hypothetical protein